MVRGWLQVCVLKHERRWGERNGRKSRAELRVYLVDMVTSLHSPGAGSRRWEKTRPPASHILIFFHPYIVRQVYEQKNAYICIHMHCSEWSEEGAFQNMATLWFFFVVFFPQLIRMLGCTAYMCVFSLYRMCVCACEPVPEGTSCSMLHTVSSLIVYDSNTAVPVRVYAPLPSWSKQTQPH